MRPILLALCLALSLAGCRVKHHTTQEAERSYTRSDSLVAVRSSANVEQWLASLVIVDSSRLVLERYDTAGRVTERITYQADRREARDSKGERSASTADTIRAGRLDQLTEATSKTSKVYTQAFAPPWWAWLIGGVASVAIILSALHKPRC